MNKIIFNLYKIVNNLDVLKLIAVTSNLFITLFSCDRQKLILISGTNTLELMLLKKYLI